ncbi:MAG: hypothetical protein II295_04055 [Akkermansia sp.]|nr:hypothetical protein [Akkermansia sp.]
MKKIVPALMIALALSSCAVKTVSRSELFTPTAATLVNSKELTDMMYYGSDNEYDYFSRGFQRLRVAKSEDAIPSSARFTFNNWQGGKKYTECIKTSVSAKAVEKLQNLFNSAGTSTTTADEATRQQRIQAVNTLLQSFSKKQ